MAAEQIHGEHYDRNPISYDVIVPCLLASENDYAPCQKHCMYVFMAMQVKLVIVVVAVLILLVRQRGL